MKTADLEKRIAELERRVAEPVYQQPYTLPPTWEPWKITSGDAYGITNVAGTQPWGSTYCGGRQQ